MCGIIAKVTTKALKDRQSANQFIVDQFQDQRNRGTQGFGIIGFDDNKKVEVHRATDEVKFMLDLYLKPYQSIIAHHRMPTSTLNKIKQTHPMLVDDAGLKNIYYVVHNGVISNATLLRDIHAEIGITYKTLVDEPTYSSAGYTSATIVKKFNDSEALAHEIALYIENQIPAIRTIGSAAFIVLEVDRITGLPVQIHFGRMTNPLNLAKSRGIMMLSSEGPGNPIEEKVLYSAPLDEHMTLSKRDLKHSPLSPFAATPATVTNKDGDTKSEHEYEIKGTKASLLPEINGAGIVEDDKEFEGMSPLEEAIDDAIGNDYDMVSNTLNDFCMDLLDPQFAASIEIEETLKDIEKYLHAMQDKALEAHAKFQLAEAKVDETLRTWGLNAPKAPVTSMK